ncbi:soluble diacylglycerol acyltransferase [Exophiala viscosa]|uniref:Soluble diacylglycerol acyltransferase n=1 Tax=Exophiala viscosa TaxID=2486360 RepID=A0AAN6E5R1_9EURO|nr:soluble diacylglycerol acyltransferase [Exophiala viscosa]
MDTKDNFQALGHYSQAFKANGHIWVAGQIAADIKGKLIEGSVKEKAALICKNLKEILEEAGSGLDKVVKVTRVKVGSVDDNTNFVNPVIHERAFDRLHDAIKQAQHDPELTLIAGGQACKGEGYFVTPTVYQTTNPKHEYMQREFFGPLLTVYVYVDAEWESVPKLIDSTSTYALTGALFARDPTALRFATDALKHSAGMFYVNTKSTGSVVAQQPFGGSRESGSNDKSGTMALLQRWTSARTVKEEFNVLEDLAYPSNAG